MATKIKRAVALCLAIMTFCSTFLVSAAANDATSSSVTQDAIASAKELLGTISYSEYAKQYADIENGTAEIVISGLDYIADQTDADVSIETYDGIEALKTSDTGVVTYKVTIPESGMYAIKLDYWPIADKSTAVQRIFRIDGKVPFSEAYYITLPKIWTTNYDEADYYEYDGQWRWHRKDIDGNEIRGTMEQTPEWSKYTLRDVQGFYKDDFEFYLEAGEHYISFEGVAQPMAIEQITIYPYEAPMSYADFIAQYANEPQGTSVVKLEAEYPKFTSTNTIYPEEDASSAVTSPTNTTASMLNIIGGDKWQTAGQRLTYTFTVDSSGMYQIVPRYIQNINDGMYSSRTLELYSDSTLKPGDKGYYNGVPFDEARELRFNYSTKWCADPLRFGTSSGDGNRIDYTNVEFYFEAGVEYTMVFEVSLGTMANIVRDVNSSLNAINNDYLNIMRLTGADPDPYRDYFFASVMPDTIIDLYRQKGNLEKVANELVALAGVKSSNVATLEKIYVLLEDMARDEDAIAKNLERLKSYIGNLGTWLNDAKTQPLRLDYILIQGADEKIPKAEANFFQAFWHELQRFFQSFFRNYDRMGATVDASEVEGANEVWLAYGRDQTQVIRNLINNDFTPSTGITIDLKLVAGGTLLPSILSGQGPDVYLGLGDDNVINYAIRGALLPVENMEGFADLALYYKVDENFNTIYDENGNPVKNPNAQFNEAAMLVLGIADAENKMHYYGLPETQNFPMMFIRTDILAELGIDTLDTWDDLMAAATTLAENNMTIGLNNDYKIFLYQMGGTLFADDGMRINLDSNVALDSFETMCNMFTQYSFPYKYDFVNRFRTGEMPIGIASYNGTYNHLVVFATELRGMWEFVPLPGYYQKNANGEQVLNNVSVSSVSSVVMINGCEDKEDAWEFMTWYTSDNTQVSYSNEMVAILGDSAKHPTANMTALETMPWTNKEYKNLWGQFENLASIPNYPGAYIIGRYTKFAFLSAYNDNADPVSELLSYITTINKEINRKREEFGLETLEVGQTLASKRRDWILGRTETGDILEDANGNKYGIEALSDSAKNTYANEIKVVTDALAAVPSFNSYCADEYIEALRNAGNALKAATASASGDDKEVFDNICEYITVCADSLKKYQASYPEQK
ncbi:MAG: extracellular solute-binding protein [Eubacteriales bacterium]